MIKNVVAIAAVLSSALLAQNGNPLAADPWAGTYQNAELKLEISKKGAQYAGTLVYNGQNLPVTAVVKENTLEGAFSAGDQKFSFRAVRDGDNLTLETDGTRFVLQRQGATAKINPLAAKSGVASTNSILGDWSSPKFAVRIAADGTAIFAGVNYRYTLKPNAITFMGPDGTFEFPYEVAGDTLTLTVVGQPTKFTRGSQPAAAMGAAGGSVSTELAGKWCYQSNIYATNGGASSSSTCVVLNPDGTYLYHGESGSSNPNGSVASQADDSGTWTATATTLSVNSRAHGPLNYPLEKRNHPKTGDPMLILGGKAFVTFYQKAPWR